MQCHYPTPPKTATGSAQSEGPFPTPLEPSQREQADDAPELPSNYATATASPAHGISETDINFDFEISTFNLPGDSNELIRVTDFDPLETGQQCSDFTPYADMGQLSRSTPGCRVEHEPGNMWESSGDTHLTPSTEESSEFCYTCLEQAMKTHEAVATAVWAQKETNTNTGGVLQKQKKVIVECIGLLDCQRCSAQPAFVMMLLSMCSKILETLGVIHCSISLNESHPDQTHWNKRGTEQTGHLASERNSYHQSMYGFGSTKKRHLDDEDELLVMRSLIKARVVKLDGLLNMLHRIISSHNWTVHEGRIRQLKDQRAERPWLE